MIQIWPAILVTGIFFAVPQFLVSNYIGPELVDVIAAAVSMLALAVRPWPVSAKRAGYAAPGLRSRSSCWVASIQKTTRTLSSCA